MAADLRASYDEFPYQSLPLRQTHPDHSATVASLFGFAATDVERCRVLEIGCASGGNLIPMAVGYPRAEFVGVDFSSIQIEEGRATIAALGIGNIRLVAMDVVDFDESYGAFDFIIAHGIYSWVPPAVQETILSLCARHLTKTGIALVSYNTLPGWHLLAIVRDAMLYQTRGVEDPRARVADARATLEFLGRSMQGDNSTYGRLLRMAADNLRQQPDYYILHDYLEQVNDPLYFHQFVERAERHRLRYLGDADFKTMLSGGLAPETAQTLDRIAPDFLRREQLLDFLRSRSFRHSLLVPEGAALDRKVRPERVMALRVAAQLRAAGTPVDVHSGRPVAFSLPDGRGVEAAFPICKSALTILADRWPLAMTFQELYATAANRLSARPGDDAGQRALLASEIMRLFVADAVELHSTPSPFAVEAGPRPVASPLARLQAARDVRATNLRHELVALDDSTRALLPLLDGTRTREEIAALHWPGLGAGKRMGRVMTALTSIGRQAFLVA
jgi:methyltransferase-like protein